MISLVADQTRREHVKLMEKTKKGSGTTDLTVGRPLPQILKFALPLVLGTLFQQLYSFVDTVIVGRCLGTDALGAVGTTYSLNFLILGFVLGSCTGFGIPVAQSFGARDSEDMHKYLFNGAVLCVVLSVVFTIVTTLTAAPLLQLIHTPAELFPDAVAYIRIIFLGIPATVLFNYTSTVLHSLGDSQHPFLFPANLQFPEHRAGLAVHRTAGYGRGGRSHRHRCQPAVQRPALHLVVLHPGGGHPFHPGKLCPLGGALRAAGLYRPSDGL